MDQQMERKVRAALIRNNATITPEQETKLKDALGDGSDWPKATDDPFVNYLVDWLVSDHREKYEEGKALYEEEVWYFKNQGKE